MDKTYQPVHLAGRDLKKEEYVPLFHPFGSITDGDTICVRCGEAITGCALCAGQPVALTRAPGLAPSRYR